MSNDHETFGLGRLDKVPGELVELFIRHGKRMRAAGVSRPQPCLADVVRHIQEMEPMRRLRAFGKAQHPGPGRDRVCREIQHHRQAGPEQGDHMRPHDVAQFGGTAHVVGNRYHLIGKKPGQPVVFGNDDRSRSLAEAGGQGRFARGGLTANEVKCRKSLCHENPCPVHGAPMRFRKQSARPG